MEMLDPPTLIYWVWRHCYRIVVWRFIVYRFTLNKCCLFEKGPQMFEEINHIPCSLHVRVALQSGLGLIWTLFRIKLHAFGKNFISFCKLYRFKSVVKPVSIPPFLQKKMTPEPGGRSFKVAEKKGQAPMVVWISFEKRKIIAASNGTAANACI